MTHRTLAPLALVAALLLAPSCADDRGRGGGALDAGDDALDGGEPDRDADDAGDEDDDDDGGASAAPTITGTAPADGAIGVLHDATITASFDAPMAALTTTTFSLRQGTTPIAGIVDHADDARSATFTPLQRLPPDTLYVATITTGAASAAGVALAADASWSFTTAADSSAPVVSGTNPRDDRVDVATNTNVAATFSEAMDALSISSTSFVVTQGTTPVAGTVAYGPGTTARFTPASALLVDTTYTATVTSDVVDLHGNALVAAYVWQFTTGGEAADGPAPVGLGAAGDYAILAKTAISTVPASTVTGDIAVSPAAASYLTGFSLVADATNVFSTSTQVVGQAFAANYAVPTPSSLTTAVANMESAYTDAAGRATPDHLELASGAIGGATLPPGLYKWTSTVTIADDVTITGGANDVWIFQTTGDLTASANKRVVLSGGAQAKNVFWQVAGKVVLGAGAHFEGVLLCKTEVVLQTGATMNGRVLAQTQVALQQAIVTQPAE